jgi:DNA adenine methylase
MGTPRPPFPYFGGKQRIAERIVSLFPEHGHYVEPYCGGLSVLMAKPPAMLETVNDIDGDIMTFWRVLRERPDEMERACALTPHSRAESLLSKDRDGLDDIERARRVWVALTQHRGMAPADLGTATFRMALRCWVIPVLKRGNDE